MILFECNNILILSLIIFCLNSHRYKLFLKSRTIARGLVAIVTMFSFDKKMIGFQNRAGFVDF
jgi:hypothetical protein